MIMQIATKHGPMKNSPLLNKIKEEEKKKQKEEIITERGGQEEKGGGKEEEGGGKEGEVEKRLHNFL